MSSRRWLYLFGPDSQTLAATIVVNDDGVAVLEPGEKYFDQVMRTIGEGILSTEERRFIPPTEGEAYVRALDEMLCRSSQWIVDDRPPSEAAPS